MSGITAAWETDGGLDRLASDFMKSVEKDTSVSMGLNFYKDYLKKYVNVSTKVNHEAGQFDLDSGRMVQLYQGNDDHRSSILSWRNKTASVNVDLVKNVVTMDTGRYYSDAAIEKIKADNQKSYDDYVNNFDINIAKLVANNASFRASLEPDTIAKMKNDIEKTFVTAASSIRYKELESKLYKMSQDDPAFSSTFKEFELLKSQSSTWSANSFNNATQHYDKSRDTYRANMITNLLKENENNVKALNDALDSELSAVTKKMNGIDQKVKDNNKLISDYEKEIANRQPTDAEKKSYEDALKVKEKLDKEKAELAAKNKELSGLQKELQDGENAMAIGTGSQAIGTNTLALGTRAKAHAGGAIAIGTDSIANKEGAIAIGTDSIADKEGAIAIGTGAKAQAQSSDVALGDGSITSKVVKTEAMLVAGKYYAVAGNPKSTVSIGASGEERTLTNVAGGRVEAGSTDAVNGSQLHAVVESVNEVSIVANDNVISIVNSNLRIENLQNNLTALGAGTASSLGGGATYDVKTGKLTNPEYSIQGGKQNNVGDALHALDGQLTTNTTNTTSNSTAITNITTGLENGTIGLVQQNSKTGVITVGKDKNGTELNISGTAGNRVITGVANGEITAESTDAVNGSQLYNAVGAAISESNNYTDQRVGEVNQRIDKLSDRANEGIAAAMAIASLAQPTEKGYAMLAVGTGFWEGKQSIAIGASGVTEDKRLFNVPVNYIFKFASTTNTQSGTWGGGASVGVQWK